MRLAKEFVSSIAKYYNQEIAKKIIGWINYTAKNQVINKY